MRVETKTFLISHRVKRNKESDKVAFARYINRRK